MSADLQFSHKLDKPSVQHASQRDLMMLASITAPQITTGSDRSAIDLVAVLDRSGSMAGGKLKAVKETMKFLVQQMSAEDRLSIVTFSDDVLTDLPLKYMTAENKTAAQVAINNVCSSGGTNLSGGLFKGIDQHQQLSSEQDVSTVEQSNGTKGASTEQARSERVRTVFLFTDGRATTGVINTVQLGSILGMMLQNPIRPTIYAFGFGADYNTETLAAIAQAGQGQSSFIEDAESIAPALASALGGLMTMSAQNVELKFTPKDGVTILGVETSFRVNAADGAFTVTLGDLYAEEKKDFLVKLQVAAVPEPQDQQEIVTLHLRYLDLAQGSMKQKSLTAAISRPADAPGDLQVDADMQEAVNRVNTANAITSAVRAADAGSLPQARRVISAQLTQLATAPNSEVTNALRGDLNQILTSYGNPGMYPSSRNHALSMAQGHSSQRSAGYSSRPSGGLGSQNSGYGPYSTRIQSDFAQRSIVAQDMGGPANAEVTDRDPDQHGGGPTSRAMTSRDLDRSLRGVSLGPQTGPLSPPPGFGPSSAAARAAGNNLPDLYPEMMRQSMQPQGAGLSRVTSNASAAGTEVYDPVFDGDLQKLSQSSSQPMWGGGPPSRDLNADPFGFADPRPPIVGTPSMPFRSVYTPHERRIRVPGIVAPDPAPSMPHGSQASPTARSSTGHSDPLVFLDGVKAAARSNHDDNAGN